MKEIILFSMAEKHELAKFKITFAYKMKKNYNNGFNFSG